MDWLAAVKKLTIIGKKYWYALAILLVGIFLMQIPETKSKQVNVNQTPHAEIVQMSLSEELSQILSKIKGVGEAHVMLTTAAGEETVYQTDTENSTDRTKINTVTVIDGQRNETGLVCQVNPAVYLGAIVVCEGADRPAVCLQVIEAVSRITGLGTDRISVLKMK